MARKSARWLRRALLASACLPVLAALILAVSAALINSRTVQSRALALINGMIPGEIAWSSLHLSPVGGRVEILDGTVADARGAEVLAFDRLFLDLCWKPLFRGVLRVDAAELDRPRVFLKTEEDGSLNLVRAFAAPAGEPGPEEGAESGGPWFPLHIAVGDLRVEDGEVSFRHGAGSLDASVEGLRLSASADTNRLEAEALLSFREAKLDMPGLALHGAEAALGLKADQGTALLTLDADLLSAPLRLRARTDLGEALPRGWLEPVLNPEALAYQVELSQEGLDLADLFPGEEGLRGRLGLRLNASGRGVSPETAEARADLDATAAGLRREGEAAAVDARVRIEAQLSDGLVRLVRLEAGAGGLALHGSGSYGLASGTLQAGVRLDAPDLAEALRLAGIPEGGGSLVLSAEAEGTPAQARAEVSVEARGVAFSGVRVGDLDARAGLARGTVSVDALEVRNGASRLTVSGSARVLEPEGFGLLADPVLDLSVEAAPIVLEDFSSDLHGRLSLSARVEGSPSSPRGRLRVNGRDLVAGGQEIRSVEVSARAAGDRVLVDALEVTLAPGESVTGTGWVSLDRAYGVALRSGGVSLGSLSRVRDAAPVEGRVTLDLSGEGTFAKPELAGEVRLEELRFRGEPLEDCTLRVDLRDGAARVAGNLGFPVEGRYGLDSGDFLASATFPDTDLAPYLALAGRPELGGRIAGRVEVQGNAATPLEAEGALSIDRLELASGGREVVRGQGVRAEIREGAFSVPSCDLVVLDQGRFSVSGGGRLDGPLDVRVDGDIPLELAALFTDEVPDIQGRLTLEARLAGSRSSPEVHADLDVAGVSFTVPELEQSLHGLRGRVRLVPGLLELEGLEGKLDTGTFRAQGRAELEGFDVSRVSATVKAAALPIEVPGTLDTRVDLDLGLEGTRAGSSIRGRLLLLDGVYYRDVNLSYLRLAREATRRRRAVEAPPREIGDPFLRNMKLDVLVQRRAPFRVENDLADLALEPDLRIIGAVNRPVVTGSARVSSGSVTFQKHTFQVTRGTIDFLNPHRTEPVIDIRSQGRIKTWTVFLQLSGTPDELELSLTSVPPEEQGDIVSLLLFGRTTRQMIEGEGGSTLSTKQQLAELISATYGEEIRKATGLDVFELGAGEEDDGASDTVRVTLGKDITRRLRVLTSTEVGDGELVTRVSSEYKLLEHFLVGLFQDTRGSYGGELVFRLEFR